MPREHVAKESGAQKLKGQARTQDLINASRAGVTGADWLWTRWRARAAPWGCVSSFARQAAAANRRATAEDGLRKAQKAARAAGAAASDGDAQKEQARKGAGAAREGWTQRLRRARHALLLSAALLGGGLGAQSASAACQPPSYCNQPGACLNIQAIKAQAAQRYGGQGFQVASVRLRPHGRTPTCLLYEVTLSHPQRGVRVVYWSIKGGEIRG